MFLKPFKVKSHTQMKTSDKRKLRVMLTKHFPVLQDEEVSKLVPLKEDVSTMKLFCHKGESVLVYMCGSSPVAFSIENRNGSVILPSVYLCWAYSGLHLAHVFVTHSDVLARLQQGADLMMPGVIFPGELSMTTFGKFESGAPAVVMCRGAVIAVGTTALSSTDLYMAGGHGKAVLVAHVVGDHLWAAGDKSMPKYRSGANSDAPHVSAPNTASAASVMAGTSTGGGVSVTGSGGGVVVVEWYNGGGPVSYSAAAASGTAASAPPLRLLPSPSTPTSTIDGRSVSSPSSDEPLSPSVEEASDGLQQMQIEEPQVLSADAMDSLLLHCFLKSIQRSKRSLPLPLLTSNFYRLHVLPCCPDNASLDIKKTSYKKLSKFLKAMEEKEILKIDEHPKGIENIVSVNYDHQQILTFRYYKSETSVKVEEGGASVFAPPTMEEVYQVSGDTIGFFQMCRKTRGECLSRMEVREVVTSYVKQKNLVDPNTKLVDVENPHLQKAIIAPKEGFVRQLKWDQVFSRLLGRMSPAVRISRPGYQDIIKKGKIEPIEMAVAKRMGNKKVTLVFNVSNFGIPEIEFAKLLQHKASASATVGPAEHKPQGTIQIQVQGNATAEVASLLLETYNIPKKYIKGLELIPKMKKR